MAFESERVKKEPRYGPWCLGTYDPGLWPNPSSTMKERLASEPILSKVTFPLGLEEGGREPLDSN